MAIMKSSIVNQLKTIGLLGGLTAVLVVIGGALAPGMLWLFGAIAVALNLGSYYFSDRIVLAMNRAHPVAPGADPALERMVADLAARAEIPVPRIYVIDDPAPNAFATGRNPKNAAVAVTAPAVVAPKVRICPRCQRRYEPLMDFCVDDGERLKDG